MGCYCKEQRSKNTVLHTVGLDFTCVKLQQEGNFHIVHLDQTVDILESLTKTKTQKTTHCSCDITEAVMSHELEKMTQQQQQTEYQCVKLQK